MNGHGPRVPNEGSTNDEGFADKGCGFERGNIKINRKGSSV